MIGGVLVIYQRGRRGTAALAEGARLARHEGEELTVLTLAPQDADPAVCGVYTEGQWRGGQAPLSMAPGQLRHYREIAQTCSRSPAARASPSTQK
jgi:hypothetical protein